MVKHTFSGERVRISTNFEKLLIIYITDQRQVTAAPRLECRITNSTVYKKKNHFIAYYLYLC